MPLLDGNVSTSASLSVSPAGERCGGVDYDGFQRIQAPLSGQAIDFSEGYQSGNGYPQGRQVDEEIGLWGTSP